ncbi:hypothetical protein GWK08_00415 [Leptobacterium flavescens]|uniref:STAS/SEC14 domain-containing protein n=1 Tax=Leptobacterium flavescens TaxID=472055 RepID=A0A6P0UJ67_9FLAO|nr:STAS/SEC14 domain-containing protein [Leptobacterium flavescens]NER11889.1 hypothetical protein [Leptobacterium flavescens]
MEKVYSLNFGNLIFYENYVVSIVNEGVEFKKEENDVLLQIARKHFGNIPYGFISYRMYSYSVDPMVYKESSQEENIKAIAIVSSKEVNNLSFEIEKLFFSKELQHFEQLDEAVNWIKNILDSYRPKKAI